MAANDLQTTEQILGRVKSWTQKRSVFDISTYNKTNGQPTAYARLSDALGTNGANVPLAERHGGMEVRFVRSSDNNYVQYFLKKQTWDVNPLYWEKVNLETTINRLLRSYIELGGLDSGTGEEQERNDRCRTEKLPVNSTVWFSRAAQYIVFYYDDNDAFLGRSSDLYVNYTGPFTTSYTNASYCRIVLSSGSDLSVDVVSEKRLFAYIKNITKVRAEDYVLKINDNDTEIGYVFEQGTLNSSDGQEADSPTRIRSQYIKTSGKFTISVKSGYAFAILFYNNSKVLESSEGVWRNREKSYTHTGFIRVIIANDNNSNISPYEYVNFVFNDSSETITEYKAEYTRILPNYYLGSLDSSGGYETDDTTRLRTGFIQVNGNVSIYINNSGYAFNYFLYDWNGNFISTPATWVDVATFQHNGLIRVIFKKTNETQPQISETSNLIIELPVELSKCNPLKGKKISVLGDSLSTYQGQIPNGYETWYSPSTMELANMWWQRMIDEEGMVKEVIDAWSGSRVSDGYSDARVPMCDEIRLSNLGNPDVIVLFGGINDWRYLCQLGEYYQSGEYDLTKFRPAYEYVLKQLLMRYPNAKLIACTPCQDGRTTDSATFPQHNSVGYLYDYVDSIKHLCHIYGVPCIDLFQNSGITYWNGQADSRDVPTQDNTKTLDGLHPNKEGQGDIYHTILKVLK